jgi:hypothetical protein
MLVFIDKPRAAAQAGFGRPNISMVGGLATENGTWMTMLADIRYWRKDRLKTLVAGATGLLDHWTFGGIGTETGGDRPLQHYDLRAGLPDAAGNATAGDDADVGRASLRVRFQ